MNKTTAILLLFLAFFTFSSYAQTNVYHPMPDSNAAWCETASYGVVCGVTERKIIRMNGDTSINSVQYHKLTATGYQNCMTQYSYFTDTYEGAFREDTLARKVYMVDPSTSTEYVLYDFTLGIGDTTPDSNFGSGIRITSIDSVWVGTNYHKRFWGTSSMFNDSANIVEGVGSNRGFYRLTWQGVEYFSYLNAYIEQGVEIFVPDSQSICQLTVNVSAGEAPERGSVAVFPNPNAGEFSVSYFCSQRGDATLELMDMYGRTLEKTEFTDIAYFNQTIGSEALTEGIYFVRIDCRGEVVTKRVIVQK
jgi:hypothetical protein